MAARLAMVLGVLAAMACSPSGTFESACDPDRPGYAPCPCAACPTPNTVCVLDEAGATTCACPEPFQWMPEPGAACCPPGDRVVADAEMSPVCCTPDCGTLDRPRLCGSDGCAPEGSPFYRACGTCGEDDEKRCTNACRDGQCVLDVALLCRDRTCGFDPVCPNAPCGPPCP